MSLISQNRVEVRHPADVLSCQQTSLTTRQSEAPARAGTIWHPMIDAFIKPKLNTYAALATQQATTAPPIH
jgi:hypothetical protein